LHNNFCCLNKITYYLITKPPYFIYIFFREEKDLKVAMQLAEKLTKNKYTPHDIEIKTNAAGGRPGILKKHRQPESTKRYLLYQMSTIKNCFS